MALPVISFKFKHALATLNRQFSGSKVRSVSAVGGLLFLRLPAPLKLHKESAANLSRHVAAVAYLLKSARESQRLLYLMSILQSRYALASSALPTFLVEILTKWLTLRYSVAFVEVCAGRQLQRTVWGRDVSSFVYWWPPLANIGELHLNRFISSDKLDYLFTC